jgi:hypothetical protein
MNFSNWLPNPGGGNGKLRALLESINEDQEKLVNHPIYKEGYDVGFKDATDRYVKLTQALYHLYNIEARD